MPLPLHDPLKVPVIETERLRLRGHRPDDLESCAALWGDPVVVRFISGRASTREETWSRLLRYAGLWAMLGYGYWAIEEKAGARFVGDIGFADFKREMDPSFDGAPEAGWALAPDLHGRGYATEAVTAALAWADQRFDATACIIAPENLASVRVAGKCGYQEIVRTTYRGDPTIMYRRQAKPERMGSE